MLIEENEQKPTSEEDEFGDTLENILEENILEETKQKDSNIGSSSSKEVESSPKSPDFEPVTPEKTPNLDNKKQPEISKDFLMTSASELEKMATMIRSGMDDVFRAIPDPNSTTEELFEDDQTLDSEVKKGKTKEDRDEIRRNILNTRKALFSENVNILLEAAKANIEEMNRSKIRIIKPGADPDRPKWCKMIAKRASRKHSTPPEKLNNSDEELIAPFSALSEPGTETVVVSPKKPAKRKINVALEKSTPTKSPKLVETQEKSIQVPKRPPIMPNPALRPLDPRLNSPATARAKRSLVRELQQEPAPVIPTSDREAPQNTSSHNVSFADTPKSSQFYYVQNILNEYKDLNRKMKPELLEKLLRTLKRIFGEDSERSCENQLVSASPAQSVADDQNLDEKIKTIMDDTLKPILARMDLDDTDRDRRLKNLENASLVADKENSKNLSEKISQCELKVTRLGDNFNSFKSVDLKRLDEQNTSIKNSFPIIYFQEGHTSNRNLLQNAFRALPPNLVLFLFEWTSVDIKKDNLLETPAGKFIVKLLGERNWENRIEAFNFATMFDRTADTLVDYIIYPSSLCRSSLIRILTRLYMVALFIWNKSDEEVEKVPMIVNITKTLDSLCGGLDVTIGWCLDRIKEILPPRLRLDMKNQPTTNDGLPWFYEKLLPHSGSLNNNLDQNDVNNLGALPKLEVKSFFQPSAGRSSDYQQEEDDNSRDNFDFSVSDFSKFLNKKEMPILEFFKISHIKTKPLKKSPLSPEKQPQYNSDDSDEALFGYANTNEY